MIMGALPKNSQPASAAKKSTESKSNTSQAQEKIYRFFLKIVNYWKVEAILLEFKHLFIEPINAANTEALKAVYEIIFYDNEEVFVNTLKRSCYILINNWWATRKYHAIQQLVGIFSDVKTKELTLSLPIMRLNNWLQRFVKSKDYQDLQLFSSVFEDREKGCWSHRYTSYLLASQYIDLRNPIEQREAARRIANQLKQKFKLDLAMYTAYSHRNQKIGLPDTLSKNPTRLGDEALHLIKKIVARRGLFSYVNLAHIFSEQTQKVNYQKFKQNLQQYIFYSLYAGNREFLTSLRKELAKKLENLYKNYCEDTLTEELILRTCNQVIEYLTTENQQQPSLIFILILSQGETLTLAITLLKIILFCKNSRAHLEAQIANLIHYYENLSEENCREVIHFLETLNIVFTVYTEDVEYNLVHCKNDVTEGQFIANLDSYRIFSQLRCSANLQGANLSRTNLHRINLSGVNLHCADLRHANLSNAYLSSANLSSADLSNADLSNANLVTADLNHANLSETNLYAADIRRANLSNADLEAATLSNAKLPWVDFRHADLNRADLSGANLHGANLNGSQLNCANLRHANLSNTDLSHAHLRGTDLSGANLSGANLSAADLSNANLRHASLTNADLHRTNLKNADLGQSDLRGTHLNETDLSRVNVKYARFQGNFGLPEAIKPSLKQRGAIFEDEVNSEESQVYAIKECNTNL